MPVDRGIIAILYYNNITDIDKVEDFIGEKNGYYEIKINGKIEKLKIPDISYVEHIEDVEDVEDVIKVIYKEDTYEKELEYELEKIKISSNKIEEESKRINNNIIESQKKTKLDSEEKRIASIEELKKREIELGIVKEPISKFLANSSGTTFNEESIIESTTEKTIENSQVSTDNKLNLRYSNVPNINTELINESIVDTIENNQDESKDKSNNDNSKKNSSAITKTVKTETYFSSDTDKNDDSKKNKNKKNTSTKSKKSDDNEYINAI